MPRELFVIHNTDIGFYVVGTIAKESLGKVKLAEGDSIVEFEKDRYCCETDCIRPNHCRVFTPDGGVIQCSTPADAERVAMLGNRMLDNENPRISHLESDTRLL